MNPLKKRGISSNIKLIVKNISAIEFFKATITNGERLLLADLKIIVKTKNNTY